MTKRRQVKTNEKQAIRPGIGLNGIIFGMTKAEVEKALGSECIINHFEDGDFQLEHEGTRGGFFFDAEDGDRLGSIELDSESQADLLGVEIFSCRLGELEGVLSQLAEKNNLPLTLVIEPYEDLDEVRVSWDELHVDFYFETSELLYAVHWGVVVKPNDDIFWPHRDSTLQDLRDWLNE